MFEGAGECTELGNRKFLGTRGRRDAGTLEERLYRDAERLEAGPQHLSALSEGCGGDAFERGLLCLR